MQLMMGVCFAREDARLQKGTVLSLDFYCVRSSAIALSVLFASTLWVTLGTV
jgi:hypothetical protein